MTDINIASFKRAYELPAPSPADEIESAPINPFEGWAQFETESPSGPVRSIPITPAILAEDAAKQAAREVPVDAWPIKAELSEDNLCLVKRKLPPGRREAPGARRVLLAPSQLPKKRCDTCKGEMGANAVHANCKACRKLLRSQKETTASPTSIAATPQPAPAIKETKPMSAPLCEGGCGRTICPSALKTGSKYAAGCSKKSGCQERKRIPKTGSALATKSTGRLTPPPAQKSAAGRTSLHAVTITLSDAVIESFWQRISIEDKVRIIAAELQQRI